MRRLGLGLVAGVWALILMVSVSAGSSAGEQAAKGWTVPQTAAQEKNPLPVNDALLAAGKRQYVNRCAKCHGDAGKGDGPQADSEHQKDMDLTRADRAAANPDGVVFYKVWNGRGEPRMPAFQDQLTKEQAWAIVAYAQTLRAKK